MTDPFHTPSPDHGSVRADRCPHGDDWTNCDVCPTPEPASSDHGSEEGGERWPKQIQVCDGCDQVAPHCHCQWSEYRHIPVVPASQLDSAKREAEQLVWKMGEQLAERDTQLAKVVGELEKRAALYRNPGDTDYRKGSADAYASSVDLLRPLSPDPISRTARAAEPPR